MPDIGRWMQTDPLHNDLNFAFDDSQVDEDDDEEVLQAIITKAETGDGIYNVDNLNPYSYGYNSPVVYDDPDGRCPACIIVLAFLLAPEPVMAPTHDKKGDWDKFKSARDDKNAVLASAAPVSNTLKAGINVYRAVKNARSENPAKTKTAEKITDKTEKKVPNPHGRKGGPAHQKGVEKAEQKLRDEGFTETRREVEVKTPNGQKSKRYIDTQGRNPTTGETKGVQVGKQNKNGTPVKRERDALDDIEKATGQRPDYHPYN